MTCAANQKSGLAQCIQLSTHLAEFILSLIWICKKSSGYYIYKAFLQYNV